MRNQFGSELRYQTSTTVGPGSLPVHRDAVKLHCRLPLDLNTEDWLLDGYIREAVKAVENDSNRALVVQQRSMYIDRFPLLSMNDAFRDPGITTNNIEVFGCPVISIDSITYTDYNGAQQTWLSSFYQVNLADEPAQIRYVWGGMWPIARIQEKSIAISYHCGYVTPFTVINATTMQVNGVTPVNGTSYRVSNSSSIDGLAPGLTRDTTYYVVNASGQQCGLSLTVNGSAVSLGGQGQGLQFLGELNPLAEQAIYLRVAASYADREGAEYEQCMDGYWSKIHGLRYEGW